MADTRKKTRRVKVKEEEVDFSNMHPGDVVLNFGMHSGKTLREVPREYLEWMVKSITNRPKLLEKVRWYLQYGSQARAARAGLLNRVVRMPNVNYSGVNSPAPAPAFGGNGKRGDIPSQRETPDDIIDACAEWVRTFYQKAAGIDPTQMSEEAALKYRIWMDTARKMQTIVDRDCGDYLPENKIALRALNGLLRGS